MKRYLLLAAFIIATIQIKASHIVGGQLYYDCLEIDASDRTLEFRMDIFRENGSNDGAQLDNEIILGIYEEMEDGSYTFYDEMSVYLNQVITVNNGDSTLLNLDGTIPYEVEIGRYLSLPYLLPSERTFYVAYQRCCRDQNPINAMFEMQGLGLTAKVTAFTACNSTPRITSFESFLGITNDETTTDVITIDPDGDSLTYEWIAPVVAGGLNGVDPPPPAGDAQACDGVTPNIMNCLPPFGELVYNEGYAFDAPFGIDVPTTLDPTTGTISTQLEIEGNYWYALLVKEYRAGELIGETILDLSIQGLDLEEVSLVTGLRYLDVNENGIFDSNDQPFNKPLLNIDPTAANNSAQYGSNGSYLFTGGIEEYIISSDNELWQINTPDNLISVEITELARQYEQHVGFVKKLDTTIIEFVNRERLFLCNTSTLLGLGVINSGTVPVVMTVEINTREVELGFLSPQPMTQLDGKLVYQTYLEVNDEFVPYIKLNTPDETNIGELFDFSISYYIGQELIDSELIQKELLCSYDPNDKLGTPEGIGAQHLISKNEELTYTIRFENFGNIAAKDIVIRDTLDEHLDIQSLRQIRASAKYELRTINQQILEISLPNIYLAPTDEDNPIIGYVQYKIKPNTDIEQGEIIQNKAGIYFDNNPPIITNTVTHKIFERPKKTGSIPENGVCVYPNPSKETMFFQLDDRIDYTNLEFNLVDIMGKTIIKTKADVLFEINVSDLPSGTYIYHLLKENGDLETAGKIMVY